MPYPYHDRNWTEITDYLKSKVRPDDRILAPDDFSSVYDRIYRYANTRLRPAESYDWAVIHKGQLQQLNRDFLRRLPHGMKPVLANPVFVVWTAQAGVEPIERTSEHYMAYFKQLQELARGKESAAVDLADEPVLPDPGVLVRFSAYSDDEFRDAMNKFWRNGGYLYSTLRDQTYYAEIDRYLVDYIGNGADRSILDICCGTGRLRDIVTDSESVVGVDISEVAIGMARESHRDRREFSFEIMDAHRLDFAAAAFDTVLFVDAIEHVRDAGRVLAEIARVTRPGGRLFLTVANKDGLNLIMSRKLGLGDFLTNYQHIREFSYAETLALLTGNGFTLLQSGGIFLFPYWGVPGIDEVVRTLTDDDPEVVEMFRVLGRRAGPEYAYSFVILAEKRGAGNVGVAA